MMQNYAVWAKVVGTKYIGTIEAESLEAAEEQAAGHPNASVALCHKCRHQIGDAEIEGFVVEEEEQK